MTLTKLDEAIEEFHAAYMLKNVDCFESCPFHKSNFPDNEFRCSIHYVKAHKDEVEKLYNEVKDMMESKE